MKKDDSNLGKYTKYYRDVAPYMGLGLQLTITILVMLYIGWHIDKYFETPPIFLVSFTFLGGILGFYNLIKTLLSKNKKK